MEGIKQEKLIVEGLNDTITIQDIIDHFKECGPINDVFIYKSKNSLSAEISFKDQSSLFNALNKNATIIKDSIINLHINSLNNDVNNNSISNNNINIHNYNTRFSKKENKIININDNEDEENMQLNDSLSSQLNKNESSLDNISNEENESNLVENGNKKMKKEKDSTEKDINDINDDNFEISDIECKVSENEDNLSDNEGYNNFMKEYKQYCKGIKKAINKHIEGEINVQELLNKANNYYLNNNYQEAKEVLETIISVSPNLQEPYLILSQIYEEEKNDEKSLFFLMLAAQSSGGDKNIWIKCCNYNKKLKNYRQAEYCITRALKLDKNNLYILYERAALNEELGDIFKAIRIYTVLFKLYPNFDILLHILILCERTQSNDKAIELFENYYDKLPNNTKIEAIIFLYGFYIKHKQYYRGYQFYKNNISLSKDSDILEMISNNSLFKLKKLFCYLYLSINNGNKDSDNNIEINEKINTDDIVKQISEELNFLINSENEAKYGDNCIKDNLNILFNILNEKNKIDIFETIYYDIEKKMIKNITLMNNYKIIISEIKYQLGNNKSIPLFEDSLLYLSPSSNSDKIKNLIIIKLSESYQQTGNKQKAIEILNKTHNNNNKHNDSKDINNINKINISLNKNINLNLNSNKEKNNDKERDKNKNKINEENINDNYENNNSIISSFEEKNNDDDNNDYDEFIQNQLNENENNEKNSNNNNINDDDEENDNEDIDMDIDGNYNNDIKNKKYNKEKYNIMADELNINKNKILNMNYIFSNEQSEDVFPSKIMENFLSRKRRFYSSFLNKYSPLNLTTDYNKDKNSNKNNYTINYDYSFDNYLHRKIRNLNNTNNNNTNNNNTTYNNMTIYDLNLNDLKADYEKLNIEIKKNIDLYLKLQESLLLLNNNEIDKFLEITYEPLKIILTQELQIENYLKDLFRYLLEKSSIKNYFNKKSNIFDKSLFDDNFSNNNISNLNISNSINNNIINLKEEDENENDILGDNDKIKNDNLFIRKSTSKIFLTKKKIVYTKNFIEKELNSLDLLSKYISKENLKKIISQFIIHSYNKGLIEEAFNIIILILNSYKIINKNNYFCYDAVIYSIMICFKKKLYKTSLELLKNSIIKYDLQLLPFFWIQLWNICTNISSSIARSYMYKLVINKNLSNNPLLKLIVSLCYYKTNYFEFCISNLKNLIDQYDNNAYLYFLLSLSYLHYAQNKRTKNKHEKYIFMKKYFSLYKIKRNYECPIEVIYNEGRLYQYLGIYNEAYNKYQEVYDKIDSVEYLNKEIKTKIKSSCVYNMHLILIKGGNDKKAQELLYNNLII